MKRALLVGFIVAMTMLAVAMVSQSDGSSRSPDVTRSAAAVADEPVAAETQQPSSSAVAVLSFDAVGTPRRRSATRYRPVSSQPCDASLPPLTLDRAEGYSAAVVEVGTNLKAESSKLSARDPAHATGHRVFVTVDPLPAATDSGKNMGFAHRIVQAAMGPTCGATRFFEDGALSGVLGNSDSNAHQRGRWFDAPVVPLSAVLGPLQDTLKIPVELLIVDAQGFDLQVLKSASRERLRAVGVVVHECQNLPRGHPELLAPDVDSCANMSSWLQGEGSPLSFGFCMHNMGHEELNCAYVNAQHPTVVAAAQRYSNASSTGELTPHAALLPFAQELWQIMCPSFTISHLFRSGCMLATLVWGDPRVNISVPAPDGTVKPPPWLAEPLSDDQCAILRSIMGVMPPDKAKRTGNTAALLACDTGRSLLHTFDTMPKKKKHKSRRIAG